MPFLTGVCESIGWYLFCTKEEVKRQTVLQKLGTNITQLQGRLVHFFTFYIFDL